MNNALKIETLFLFCKKIFFYAAFSLVRCFNRADRNKGFIALGFPEFHDTVSECEDGEIPSHTYVLTGMINRSALAYDDVSSHCGLSTKDFHAEAFAFRIATVFYTAFAFLMCHSE
jgi:hypothetical protein